ncbi:cytochrome P450 monooxygenase [Vararia minispora EC-137]|uniref:Cytochrome P450 monooxygenase n=1 Tax=Vararia minispora EC-137 TaxID=1314806 RepID=A0ACB8QFB2_9AGAM|nr:cytochrome P450 monooxygenase [Vararia minispora EC-137]
MSVLASFLSRLQVSPFTAATLLSLLTAVIVLVVPWAVDKRGLRRFPGPFFAQFTDFWLGSVASSGRRCETIYALHEKYGPLVRIAPNHVSLADPDALHAVYAHGSNLMKSDFYDVFVTITPGLFNTRDRAAHARKRKIISHAFSLKSVLDFQPIIHVHLKTLLYHWDRICEQSAKGCDGEVGDCRWVGRDGRAWFDCFPWWGYLSFDIIGDLCFGSPFGMLAAAADAVPVVEEQSSAIAQYGQKAPQAESQTVKYFIPAVRVLHKRGAHAASAGVLRPFWRAIINRIVPWYSTGHKASQDLTRMAIAAVAKRLATPVSDRIDILSRLREGKDEFGEPLGPEELTAEAQTLMLAGSDTTTNTLTAAMYYLAGHPVCQRKLQHELDEALATEASEIPFFESIKNLEYLNAVMSETLRLHSVLGQGVERVVPKEGVTVLGQYFAEGTVLSVPSYNLHHNEAVWGEDVNVFRPERWLEQDMSATSKAFYPFSFGPRACVGRNLALMDIPVVIATMMRRYDFVLEDMSAPDVLPVSEAFLRKPRGCRVGVRLRFEQH